MKRASSYQKLHPISEPKGLHRDLRKRFYGGLEALDKKNFPSTGDYFGPYSLYSVLMALFPGSS